MNAAPGESEIFMVGRFIFSAVNFISISKQIADSLAKGTFQTILLDEIGPLELKQQKGFYNLLSLLLKDISTTTRLVLVARESCLADLMLFLQQSGYKGIPCTTGNFETMFEQRNNQDC
jgi:nucleoside-triphosphatase THEP1